MSNPRRFAGLVFVGMLLAQAAWMLAIPPYRAIDEFDHVHRAAGVATGQWRLTEPATDGRGLLVVVPQNIVDAASAQCASLPYTGSDNCFAVRELPGGRAEVATAAGGYHPAYYAVTGTVARPFDGAAADYAMRIFSALMCALGLAFSAYCLGLARAGPWTKTGFVASLTPVLIYTTIIPAPNSWEIVSGLCVWTTLLAAGARPRRDRRTSWLLLAAFVAACVLVTPRALGPLWLVLIVPVTAVFVGKDPVAQLVCGHRRLVAGGVLAVAAATVCSAWWTVSAGSFASSDTSDPTGVAPDADVAMSPARWVLGTVGAFPFRDQPAPIPVYVLYLLVVGAMLWLGVRHGLRRERAAILTGVALTLLVPITLTWRTAEQMGAVWQGRYGLAFTVGLLVLCGIVLDRIGWAPVEGPRMLRLGLTMLGIAQVWSVVNVAHEESVRSVSAGDPGWVTLSPPLIGAIMLLGFVIMTLSPWRAISERPTRSTTQGGEAAHVRTIKSA